MAPRLWVAGGVQYDSGLPFEFDGEPATVLAEYGAGDLNRINFNRGRIDPAFLVNASAGADIYKSEQLNMKIQVDGQNSPTCWMCWTSADYFPGTPSGRREATPCGSRRVSRRDHNTWLRGHGDAFTPRDSSTPLRCASGGHLRRNKRVRFDIRCSARILRHATGQPVRLSRHHYVWCVSRGTHHGKDSRK